MGFFSRLKRIFKPEKHSTYYTFDRDLPADEIADNRERILGLLRSTDRKGVEKVIAYMEKYDFFNVPSSIHHHHNYRGGLAQHVLAVYDLMRDYDPSLPADSVAIVSILHDICKADKWHYQSDGGLRRNHGKDQRRGRKSIKILKDCGFDLTEAERLAIRWHMGGHNAKAEDIDDAARARMEPLWKVLFKCNKEDSYQ